jgi:hypothetical protein
MGLGFSDWPVVERTSCFGPGRGEKPLQRLRIWRITYANGKDSQPALRCNRGLIMIADYFARWLPRAFTAKARLRAINLPKYARF